MLPLGKRRKTTFEERAAALKARLTTPKPVAAIVERRPLLDFGDREANLGLDEVPLTVTQAARLWGQSPTATRRYFKNVTGVRIIPSQNKLRNRPRSHSTLLIPPSVLRREIRKHTDFVMRNVFGQTKSDRTRGETS